MPRVIFYEVNIDDESEGSCAVTTLREARQVRRNRGTPGIDGAIHKIVASAESMRELACAIFNREKYAERRDLIMDGLLEEEIDDG